MVAESEQQGSVEGGTADGNEDNYPSLAYVVGQLMADPDIPETGIMHMEVHCFANGEATYRVWVRGVEEPEGGAIAPE